MKEAVIVSAVRTPLGSFGGSLKNISAVDLGSLVIKSALERANLKAEQVDEVIMGNVLGAGLGQNVARQMSVNAGIPVSSPAFTVNKVWCRKYEPSTICAAKSTLGLSYGRL